MYVYIIYIYMENLNGFNYPSRLVDDENDEIHGPMGKHASNTCSASAGHGARSVCQVRVRSGGSTADSLLRGMFTYP